MALRTYWTHKSLFSKSLSSFYILYCRHGHTRKKSILITTDALDEFTTQLLQKKTTKWDVAKERAKNVQMKDCKLAVECCKFDVNRMNLTDLDSTFQSAIEDKNNKNLTVLIDGCLKHQVLPSMIVLTNLLSYFSTSGNCDVLNSIIKLCEVVDPEILTVNSNFDHYMAEAISVNGDTNAAIALFEKVYVENTFLRRRIRFMLKHVVWEVVNNKGEAAIISLLKFAETLHEIHKDIYPLACMWEACFLSEWFAEQKLAIDMLKRHRHLLSTVTGRINFLVNISMRKQQFDPVLRLLEYLLENKLQMQYSIVIVTMFDYNYKRGNLKSCIGIVNWMKKYDISLPISLGDKYLDLVFTQMKHKSMKMVVEKLRAFTKLLHTSFAFCTFIHLPIPID